MYSFYAASREMLVKSTTVGDDGEELYLEVAKVYDDRSRLLRCQK